MISSTDVSNAVGSFKVGGVVASLAQHSRMYGTLFNLPSDPQTFSATQYDLTSAMGAPAVCMAAHFSPEAAHLFYVAPAVPQSTNELDAVYWLASVPVAVVYAVLDPFMISAIVTVTSGNGQTVLVIVKVPFSVLPSLL